jgi:hypothetical protein
MGLGFAVSFRAYCDGPRLACEGEIGKRDEPPTVCSRRDFGLGGVPEMNDHVLV